MLQQQQQQDVQWSLTVFTAASDSATESLIKFDALCRRRVPALAPDWWLWFLPGLPPPIHLPASACLLSCPVIGSPGSSFTYPILPQLV
ncbi:hypothetical protein JOB18_038871 [Solea senegalensis]|uniref:Uncharacterized protein n=1 Tax=Solea senegalensis TaxID=28829 RepID=A0AAV6T9R9_SOLSE|nr:hypothetical protein JOB18_038871 [Solea senegalensis]